MTKPTCRMRFALSTLSAGLALTALLAPASGRAQAQAPDPAAAPLAITARNLTVGAPTGRIYRSVGRDGSVVLSDVPEAGAQEMQVRNVSRPPDARQRAELERDYWRARARDLDDRLRQREGGAEAARGDREVARDLLLVLVREPWPAAAGGVGQDDRVASSFAFPDAYPLPRLLGQERAGVAALRSAGEGAVAGPVWRTQADPARVP